MLTVKQLSRLAGITPRALRHYDAVGLLKPTAIGSNGYRYYDRSALLRLQQILFYRELDLPLDAIRTILDQPGFDAMSALQQHRAALQTRRSHLDRLLETVDSTILHLKGQYPMSDSELFKPFSDEEQSALEAEAEQLYDPEIVKASSRRWKTYTAAEKQRIFDEGNAIYRDLIAAIPLGPASDTAQACIARWRAHMSYFWTPNDEQLLGIAQGYVHDPRFRANFDQMHPQLAEFVLAAVQIYLQK
jgi:DNA-binding transcriptional MerR regulator